MVLYFILTALDLFAAGSLVLGHFGLVKLPLLYAAIYLIAKLAFFFRDFLSWIDACAGVYFLFVLFGHPSFLTWVFLGWFAYKISIALLFRLAG